MLQGREYSAILSTIIKLPFAVKIFVLSIFEWLLKTGFTVYLNTQCLRSLSILGLLFLFVFATIVFIEDLTSVSMFY